jgi:hypothetical protein
MSEKRRQPSRAVDEPKPGYFLTKLVRGGALVPGRIIHRFGKWQAVIDGVAQPPHADPLLAPGVSRLWLGDPTTKAEYDRRLALKKVDGHPAQTPRKRIDLTTAKPPSF